LALDLLLALKGARRVAVVGIGSDLRADDAAGVEVVRRLRRHLTSQNVLLIDAGVAPENFTAEIKKFGSSHVLMIDATDLGLESGTASIVDLSKITGPSIFSHRLPLSIFADYLRAQVKTQIILLGIQPANARMGAAMSEQVKKAVDDVVKILCDRLRSL
jgi:hydrogenase maturation protease HycI